MSITSLLNSHKLISPTSMRIASNTFYQLLAKFLSMLITVLGTVIITRVYGRVGYGEFSLMQNIPALFFIIADFGMNAIAIREVSKNSALIAQYFVNVLLFRITISVVLMLVCILAVSFFPYSQALKSGIYLASLLILTQALFATTNIVFQAKLRYDLSAFGYLGGYLLILLLVLVLSFSNAPVMWVNFSYVLGGLSTFAINLYLVSRLITFENIKLDLSLLRKLFIASLPLGLMFIFSQINFKADSIMLSLLPVPARLNVNTTEATALYGLSYKIFEVLLVFPTFFMNALYPIYLRHYHEDVHKFKRTFYVSLLALLSLGLATMIVGILFAPLMITLLGGSAFTMSTRALQYLFIGMPIFFFTQPFSWFLVTLEKQKYLPLVYFISAIFNLVSNFYLIPVYSFYASAVITWVSELIVLILLIFYAHYSWKWRLAAIT